MIFLVQTIGQRSNQIWQHISFDSYCRFNKIKFVNFELKHLQKNYPTLRKKYFFYTFIAPLFAFSFKVLNKLHIVKIYNLDNSNDLNIFFKKKQHFFTCVKGFHFSNPKLLQQYRHIYKEQFLPNCTNELYDLFSNYTPTDYIIGLHIRRGDYKEFEGGKYYYSDEEYTSLLTILFKLLPKNTKLIIFTNDKELNKNCYKTYFPQCAFSSYTTEIDHSLMASCTYLMGAPSTFTMLASFLGQVPLYAIESVKTDFTLNNFIIYNQC